MLRANQHHNVIKNIYNKNVRQQLWITIAKLINAMKNLFAAVKESSYQTSKSLCSTQSGPGLLESAQDPRLVSTPFHVSWVISIH